MKKKINLIIILVICLLFTSSAYPESVQPEDNLKKVADWLVQNQRVFGAWGNYLIDFNYNGPIIAGLSQAYKITDDITYKESAELAANFTILFSNLNFLGDEAYGLAKLGKDTDNDVYIDVIRNFYNGLDTYSYIRGYNDTTAEKATFYISFHAVASYMVDANDAGIWRESILEYLPQVYDDLSYFPVMTLGVATWALAKTGPMDDTLIDPLLSKGVPYWEDVKLSDLPDILSTHQVLSGEHKGSFYVRFDHTAPGPGFYESGYTEDTIFGLFGLIASNKYRKGDNQDNEAIENPDLVGLVSDSYVDPNDPNRVWDFDDEIQDAREAIAQSIQTDTGEVLDHIWDGTYTYYFFGGELLETFDEEYVYPKEEVLGI